MLLAPVLLAVVGGLVLMGDSFPGARAGVAVSGDQLTIVAAACEGERLRSIELRRQQADSASDGSTEVLWRVDGDIAMPSEIPVGSIPAAMEESQPFNADLGESDRLALVVISDQTESQQPIEFTIDEIPRDGILGPGGPALIR